MANLRLVDPGELRLPPGRQSGPDLWRLQDQMAKFGGATESMSPVLVTAGKNGELMINNGVTRAVRVHRCAPGKLIAVEIIESRPRADFSRLRKVLELS